MAPTAPPLSPEFNRDNRFAAGSISYAELWEEWKKAGLGFGEMRDEVVKRLDSCQQTQASYLDLSCLPFSQLPPIPGCVTQLNLSQNVLLYKNNTTLSASIKELDILHCKLEVLPFALPQGLSKLNVSFNMLIELEDIPANLETLIADNNFLTTLPASLPSLRLLSVKNNQLTCLPDLLENVISVFAENNLITSFPLMQNNLKIFNLAHNKIKKWPPDLSSNLEYLNIEHNFLKKMTLTKLENLLGLNISHNCLQQIKLNNCPNLCRFEARKNLLTKISHLPLKTAHMDIAFNQVKTFPTLHGKIIKVDARHNKIKSLPGDLKHLPSGTEIDVTKNPLSWKVRKVINKYLSDKAYSGPAIRL